MAANPCAASARKRPRGRYGSRAPCQRAGADRAIRVRRSREPSCDRLPQLRSIGDAKSGRDHAMTLDPKVVTSAVEELAIAFRADGADLTIVEVNPRSDRIHLKLQLEGVHCAECVLPPDMLYKSLLTTLARQVPGEFELIIDDPRGH